MSSDTGVTVVRVSLSSVVQRWTVHDQKWLGSSQEAGVPDYGASTGRKEDWGRKTSWGSCSWAQGTGEESADKRGGQCTRIKHNWLLSWLRLLPRGKLSFSRVAKNKRKSITFTGLLLSEWTRLGKLQAKCICDINVNLNVPFREKLLCSGKYMYCKTEIIHFHWFLYHLAFTVQGKCQFFQVLAFQAWLNNPCLKIIILCQSNRTKKSPLRQFVYLGLTPNSQN